jgi:hypothetical protein
VRRPACVPRHRSPHHAPQTPTARAAHAAALSTCAGTSHTMPPLDRRDIENLVHDLGADSLGQQTQALRKISNLIGEGLPADGHMLETLDAISAAGAIPLLVGLVGEGNPAAVQKNAAGALSSLARCAECAVTIATGARLYRFRCPSRRIERTVALCAR